MIKIDSEQRDRVIEGNSSYDKCPSSERLKFSEACELHQTMTGWNTYCIIIPYFKSYTEMKIRLKMSNE